MFKWANILTTNISQAIITFVRDEGTLEIEVYMSLYLIDAICTRQQYSRLDWNGSHEKGSIHV